MKLTQIRKLYLSNFLTGLVFWYGIEKLFMTSIGIDAAGVGIVSAVSSALILGLEIPGGMLADKWSRKGTLILSAVSLALSSVILGFSDGIGLYILGAFFYCIFLVNTNGIYQAIVYDSLHEEKRSHEYSKIMGRAYGLFLAGAGVANMASGFIGSKYGYPATFFISVVPCVLNVLLLASVKEPSFRKPENKQRLVKQIGVVSREISRTSFLRTLVIMFAALSAIEVFKLDFGQLYIIQYVSAPQAVGMLWAFYAFMWAAGSMLAHRMRTRLTPLFVVSAGSLVLAAFINKPVSLLFFAVQILASAALINQIETRIQEHTPSSVRASILSVMSALSSLIAIPVGLLVGMVIRDSSAFRAVQIVALIAVVSLAFWLIQRRRIPGADEKIAASPDVVI